MKFFSTMIVAAMALVATAAPTAEVESSGTLVKKSPTGHHHGHHEADPNAPTPILPTMTIQIHESQPDKAYGNTKHGKVFRSNGSKNIQTLVQFEFGSEYQGRSCFVEFNNPSYLSGSQGLQIFTLGEEITKTDTWNDRPFRDQHVATVRKAVWSGHSELETFGWDDIFDCPVDETWSFELVPTGDNDEVSWTVPNGFVIYASPW